MTTAEAVTHLRAAVSPDSTWQDTFRGGEINYTKQSEFQTQAYFIVVGRDIGLLKIGYTRVHSRPF